CPATVTGPAGRWPIRDAPRAPERTLRRPAGVSAWMIALRRYSPVPGSTMRPLMEPVACGELEAVSVAAWPRAGEMTNRLMRTAAARPEHFNFNILGKSCAESTRPERIRAPPRPPGAKKRPG